MKSSKKQKVNPASDENLASARASISFPQDIYQTLELLASQKRAAMAWVVRDAAEQYIAKNSPPLRRSNP